MRIKHIHHLKNKAKTKNKKKIKTTIGLSGTITITSTASSTMTDNSSNTEFVGGGAPTLVNGGVSVTHSTYDAATILNTGMYMGNPGVYTNSVNGDAAGIRSLNQYPGATLLEKAVAARYRLRNNAGNYTQTITGTLVNVHKINPGNPLDYWWYYDETSDIVVTIVFHF